MRIVLTTVTNASCIINNEIVGSINKGFLLLAGFEHEDNESVVLKMVDKLLSLRVFSDENGLTNLSLDDVKGDILSISQFTLYADARKGRRPSFINAMKGEESSKLYDYFNKLLEGKRGHIEKGIFGADMLIESTNDGPFTLILDSKELFL